MEQQQAETIEESNNPFAEKAITTTTKKKKKLKKRTTKIINWLGKSSLGTGSGTKLIWEEGKSDVESVYCVNSKSSIIRRKPTQLPFKTIRVTTRVEDKDSDDTGSISSVSAAGDLPDPTDDYSVIDLTSFCDELDVDQAYLQLVSSGLATDSKNQVARVTFSAAWGLPGHRLVR